jgi:hypothetical protein
MSNIFIIPNDNKYKQSIKPNDKIHNKSNSISPNNNIVLKGIQSRKGNNTTSNNTTNNNIKQIEKPDTYGASSRARGALVSNDTIVSRQAKIKAKANKNYLF